MSSSELSEEVIAALKMALMAAPPPPSTAADIQSFFDRNQSILETILSQHLAMRSASLHGSSLSYTPRAFPDVHGSDGLAEVAKDELVKRGLAEPRVLDKPQPAHQWPAWQTFDEFRMTPSALAVSRNSVLGVDPGQETAATLARFLRRELQILASISGAPKGGTKNEIAHRIVEIWNLRKELSTETVETLEKRSGAELRRFLDALNLFKGGNKHTKAVTIMNWRNEVRSKGRNSVAEGNWLASILSLSARGLAIPSRTRVDLIEHNHGWLLDEPGGDTNAAPDTTERVRGGFVHVTGMSDDEHDRLVETVKASIAYWSERVSDPAERRDVAIEKLAELEAAFLRQTVSLPTHEPGQAGYSDSRVSSKRTLYRQWFRQNAETLISLGVDLLNPSSAYPIAQRLRIEVLRDLPPSMHVQTMLPQGSIWEVEGETRAGNFFFGWDVRVPGQGIHVIPKNAGVVWHGPPQPEGREPARYEPYSGWKIFSDALGRVWAVRGRIAISADSLSTLYKSVDQYVSDRGQPNADFHN